MGSASTLTCLRIRPTKDLVHLLKLRAALGCYNQMEVG